MTRVEAFSGHIGVRVNGDRYEYTCDGMLWSGEFSLLLQPPTSIIYELVRKIRWCRDGGAFAPGHEALAMAAWVDSRVAERDKKQNAAPAREG
ncbi:MAG TPA: hypothetical protein VL494_13875 [Steroidobacteraceae bacterium]|jgi:hypothetical protein|nr:hypothetical protein [Steroidobacteraceae bacterium]